LHRIVLAVFYFFLLEKCDFSKLIGTLLYPVAIVLCLLVGGFALSIENKIRCLLFRPYRII